MSKSLLAFLIFFILLGAYIVHLASDLKRDITEPVPVERTEKATPVIEEYECGEFCKG